jgi:multidrug efflux system membrane fusion protein
MQRRRSAPHRSVQGTFNISVLATRAVRHRGELPVPETTDHKPVRRRRFVLIAAGLAIAAAAGALYLHLAPGSQASRAATSAPRAGVPVRVAAVERRDVPVELSGLGSVQASFTVAIHAQVDGIMEEVLFTEGDKVKKGDVLARIDPRLYQAALDQAKAKRLQDVALLGSAAKDLDRSKELVAKNVGTQQLVDQQQARVDQLKATIAADEAAIETAQTQLDYTTIRARSDGRIGVRQVDPGNLVHASDTRPIATLVLTQPSSVMFTLPMQHLDDVRTALARGPVAVTAFDQANLHELSSGKLLLIDNVIDQATATIRLKAMFANADDRLWPGEFVNAHVLVETRRGALVIPSTAVQRGPQGLFAWIVSEKDTALARPIRPGPVAGNLTIVTDGLAEGERVVTDGQYKLELNARVAIVNASASAEAAR